MICNPYFKHMKKIFTKVFAILFAALTLSGCSIIIRTDDSPAKAFEGTYAMSVHETGTWGQSRVDDRYQAVVIIEKAGYDLVEVSGAFETFGRVDGNRLILEPVKSEDSHGTLTTSFVECQLVGNQLSMRVRQSGNIFSIHTGTFLNLNTTLSLSGSR